MLSRAHRLRSAEVNEILAQGRPIRGNALSARVLPAKDGLRAAVVVPKSVAKTAVMRNRIRRAAYRELAGLPAPRPAAAVLFFVRRIPPPPLAPALREEIGAILKQVK